MRRILFWLGWLLFTAGCGHNAPVAPNPNPRTGEGIAEQGAMVDALAGNLEALKPHVQPAGVPLLTASVNLLSRIGLKTVEIMKLNETAGKQYAVAAQQVADARADLAHDREGWRGWVGYKLRRLFMWLMIGWGVVGAASVIFGLGNPVGWLFTIGHEVRQFLPFMNPFSWLTKWIAKRKGGPL